MSKLISELLGANEPLFSLSIRQLEKVTGRPSVDIKLAAEIINKMQDKTKSLGFDPKDTTGRELYHGLMNRIKQDNEHLSKLIGCQNVDDVNLGAIKEKAQNTKLPKKAWVLKKSVAKEFIRKIPPKKIMEKLGYKSVDSMLKTENITEVYGALRFAENPRWLKNFNKRYKTITPSDFEQREVEILEMDTERWGILSQDFVKNKFHNVTHSKELGAVYLLPAKSKHGLAITVLPLIFHYINEIRLYSTFFKMSQVKKDFAEIVVETLNNDPKNTAIIAGQNMHWRVLQRYFGKHKKGSRPEEFEPHVQTEDLIWRQAEHILFEMDEGLGWWKDLDYIGVVDGKSPVSLNLLDVVLCYRNNLPFKSRVFYSFREALWNELFARYMGEEILENQILKQLDSQVIIPETIHDNLY